MINCYVPIKGKGIESIDRYMRSGYVLFSELNPARGNLARIAALATAISYASNPDTPGIVTSRMDSGALVCGYGYWYADAREIDSGMITKLGRLHGASKIFRIKSGEIFDSSQIRLK